MVYEAQVLLALVDNLTLVGQDSEGDLEWVGTDEDWANSEVYE